MVKVALTPLSESEFISLLNKHNHVNYLRGGSLKDINIFRSRKKVQRGNGIFSIISNLGRRALPYLSKYLLPVAKDFGKAVITDVLGGQTLKSSLKKRGKEGVKSLGKQIIGGKGKKKRANKSRIRKRKKMKIKRGTGKKKSKSNKRKKKQVKKGKGKKQKPRKNKLVKKKKKRRTCHSYMTDIFSS